MALRLARQRNSGTRFAVWFSALMAMAVLPLLRGTLWLHGGGVASGGITNHSAIIVPSSWALYLFAAWAAMAGWALLRVCLGVVQLRALRKSCICVEPDSLDAGLRETLAHNLAGRPVALCLSDQVQVPTAIGFLKPAVVIPRWLMHELSPAQLNQVVLHELAHLRRWDDWTNLAQQIVKALLFFHPAVWWIERRISLEREMACDDAVLAETASPRAYAECLAHLAEKSFLQRGVALAQAAVGRMRQTSLRVAKILDANRPGEARPTWKPAVALVAGFAMVCVVGVSRVPTLVAFQDSVPPRAVSPAPVIASNAALDRVEGLHVLPTAAITRTAAWKPAAPARPARVVKARSEVGAAVPSSSGSDTLESRSFIQQLGSQVRADDLAQRASLRTMPPTTEAVFVVVEGHEYGETGQAVYQISVWHVTFQQPSPDPGSKTIPRKT